LKIFEIDQNNLLVKKPVDMISLLNFCLIRLDPNKTHSICLHVNLVFENVRTIIIIKTPV